MANTRIEIETPQGQQTVVRSANGPRRLSELLRREQLPLNTRCGQRGLCDGCLVELLDGDLQHIGSGETVTAGEQPRSVRGCEHDVIDNRPVRIRIPHRSLLAYAPQVVSEFRLNVARAQDPVWQTVEFQDGADLHAALARQSKRRRPIRFAPGLAEPANATRAILEYRDDHWLVTGFNTGPAASRRLGVAIDIGTTTVALLVVDLADGQIVGRASGFNRQMHLGDDVATRIGLCAEDPALLGQLQEAVIDKTIVPLLETALEQGGHHRDAVVCVTVTANTTMLHLFAGENPSGLGTYPFQPVFLDHRIVRLPALANATVHLVPSAGSFIGSDITAGVLTSGLAYDDGPSLLVDVGTNGEIILKAGSRLIGCATAAGPAFEGAGLKNGIRATAGAIESMQLTRPPLALKTKQIGDGEVIGICGSAYVDFLATGHRCGLLTPTGRFAETLPGDERWIIQTEDGRAVRVARGPGKEEIVVTETDVASLLQSKAAIGAGIQTLLNRTGVRASDIQRLYLAGGFGLHIDIQNAIDCGLLPGFEPSQIEVVGNTSLAGAYLSLLDCGGLDEITRISRSIDVIELNLDPGFEDCYIENLRLDIV